MFDLLDQVRQVGLVEADAGGRNSVVFDVWEDVFVMRIGAGQFGHVWVLERIVLEDFVARSIDLVAVVEDPLGVKVEELPHIQRHIVWKGYLPLQLGKRRADSCQHQGRTLDGRMPVWEGVDKFAIGPETG